MDERELIRRASQRLDRFKQRGNDTYNFRCPFCGDSEYSETKARGYFYWKDGHHSFKCHNCGKGMSLSNFIKQLFPEIYNAYLYEQYTPSPQTKTTENTRKKLLKLADSSEFYNLSQSISSLSSRHPARVYLEQRKIPSKFFNFLRWAEDTKAIGEYFGKELWNEERIIIPYLDIKRNLIGCSLRSITDGPTKYISLVPSGSIFGIDRLKLSGKSDIYVTEGEFDSLFLENAIALGGVTKGLESLLQTIPFPDRLVFILDNQPRNKEVVSIYHRLASDYRQFRVFVWPSDISSKDINELVKQEPDIDLKEFVQLNTCRGLILKAKIANWSKV